MKLLACPMKSAPDHGDSMLKRIALIGYPAEYFVPFARSLEEAGFQVFWVTALHADACFLRSSGIDSSRILDTAYGFSADDYQYENSRTALLELESIDLPKINDIIMMDRILSKKSREFSIAYMSHLQKKIQAFLVEAEISLITSWRDTAMQLITMLIARKNGIPYVIATRARIPQEMYGFCLTHTTEQIVSLRPVSLNDKAWADAFLEKFETKRIKPALKKSARGLSDVVRLLPVHGKVFLYELRRSLYDIGNDYTRYPIRKLVLMYMARRANLLKYKIFNPCDPLGSLPYCLYAMHTQPESSIDVVGSYFSDQIGLIRFIARSLPANMELYVKVHPTDVDGKNLRYYRGIKKIPGVRLVDYSYDSILLLKSCQLLFAITGTIAYEAALLGKPVIVFARNFFNRMPTIAYCDAPPALPSLISRMLNLGGNDRNRAEILAFLSELRAACYDGEVSRTYGASSSALTPQDLETIKSAYIAVYEHFWPNSSAKA